MGRLRRFHSLGPEVQRQVPVGSSMMIFLHRRSDVEKVTQLLNADASKAARCVCHRDCALGTGCREQNVPTAVVRCMPVRVAFMLICCPRGYFVARLLFGFVWVGFPSCVV